MKVLGRVIVVANDILTTNRGKREVSHHAPAIVGGTDLSLRNS
jgi:hypothetical protein